MMYVLVDQPVRFSLDYCLGEEIKSMNDNN